MRFLDERSNRELLLIGFLVGVIATLGVAYSLNLLAKPIVVKPVSGPVRVLEFEDAVIELHATACEIPALLDVVPAKDRKQVKGGLVKPKAPGAPAHKLCYYEKDGLVTIADEFGNSGLFTTEQFKLPLSATQVRIVQPTHKF